MMDLSQQGWNMTVTTDEAASISPGTTLYPIWSVAFWGFLLTQFLGAFNDNYFKQMVLLTSVSQLTTADGKPESDRQWMAMAAFASAFVLLSGFGGFLSDCYAKRRVIVGCKIAEVGIMGISLAVLLVQGITPDTQLFCLIGVLFLMGSHSAIFAPAKYGALPEIFHADHLLPVNGAVQMTTFLAIIFGTVGAGIALDQMGQSMWVGSLIAMGIASAGTFTSFFIPATSPAQSSLRLKGEDLFLPKQVAQLVWQDRRMFWAIIVASVFWFLGGVTQMAVNTLGKSTLGLSDTRTSMLVAGIGFGIMAGCLIAGFLGTGRSGRTWVFAGAWMLFASLLLIAGLGSGLAGAAANANMKDTSIFASLLSADLLEWSLRFSMVALGVSAGMFVVPVQVYLQQAPPADLKGRLLGVQNLATWIGILLSAAFTGVSGMLLKLVAGSDGDTRHQWAVFASLALIMLPVSLFYRLPESEDALPSVALS